MKYSLEEIYLLVGKEDKTAGLTLKPGSESYNKFGSFITVLFLYTQYEREDLDAKLKNESSSNTSGKQKAKYLGSDLSEMQINKLRSEGVRSDDILEILYYRLPSKNTFHSQEPRQITPIEIKIRTQKKGRDFDWIYGFKKRQIKEGVALSPDERDFYLACKYYYEPDELTESEVEEIFYQGLNVREAIEWHYLGIKFMREDITDEQKKRLAELLNSHKKKRLDQLDHYLKQAGSSLKKLAKENLDQAAYMFDKVLHFKERRLNVIGKIPVYIDIEGYLHIYLRHVEEMQVNRHFEHKDNFQWREEDVFMVMEKVINSADQEIQHFFEKNPGKRFSKYGRQSVYFEGDYYTFHIESNGRISTFHKNKKASVIEKDRTKESD